MNNQKFKIGDRVVCVSFIIPYLKNQTTYIVRDTLNHDDHIALSDMKGNIIKGYYYASRFIPIKESRKNKINEINGKQVQSHL